MYFEVFLKVPVIIIMRFGKYNVLCPKYIDIYEFQWGYGRDVYGPPYIFLLLKKKYKSMTYAWIKFYILIF